MDENDAIPPENFSRRGQSEQPALSFRSPESKAFRVSVEYAVNEMDDEGPVPLWLAEEAEE